MELLGWYLWRFGYRSSEELFEHIYCLWRVLKKTLLWADFFLPGIFGIRSRIPFYFFLWQKTAGNTPPFWIVWKSTWTESQLKGFGLNERDSSYCYQTPDLMSSHHFVKEQQETAVFNFRNSFDQIFWDFWWGPTILVVNKSLGSSFKLGIKLMW